MTYGLWVTPGQNRPRAGWLGRAENGRYWVVEDNQWGRIMPVLFVAEEDARNWMVTQTLSDVWWAEQMPAISPKEWTELTKDE